MRKNSLAIHLADFYKVGHIFQGPKYTTMVYSNMTPRVSRLKNCDSMVFFGLQYFVKEYLIDYFNENFFNLPLEEVLSTYKRRMKNALGKELQSYDHIVNLHKLGYLPIHIKALPEGTKVPMRVPCLTIRNTHPDFHWLTNYLEVILSTTVWQPSTSATIAAMYRTILNKYADITGLPKEFVDWQGHDFSFRGMSSLESAITSGMGHLLAFTGTDTIPAIDALEYYYNADSDKEIVGGSVNATEHSVMQSSILSTVAKLAAGDNSEIFNEYNYGYSSIYDKHLGTHESLIEVAEYLCFKELITERYPDGIISIVSDTFNLFDVLTKILPRLKDHILKRDGKVVIRPDSGDPVNIICGDPNGETEAERKGAILLLWELFGGTITSKGYKLIDSHIGLVYGDSITVDRCEEICRRLEEKGFASQCILGIGSFTYQYNTRDTFGTAIKATCIKILDEIYEIYKKPATDKGSKHSAKGLLLVSKNENGYQLNECVDVETEKLGELKDIFIDGKLIKDWTLSEIRSNLKPYLQF